ncbi:hypothetical protein AB6D11_00865 [Vibrio splendidus]
MNPIDPEPLESAIVAVCIQHIDNHAHIAKWLRRERRDWDKTYTPESVDRALAAIYPEFERTNSSSLHDLLFECQERTLGYPHRQTLINQYEKEGALVHHQDHELYFVTHPNTQDNHVKVPIQVTTWVSGQGVFRDSGFASLDAAINEYGLHKRPILTSKQWDTIVDTMPIANDRERTKTPTAHP